MEEEVDKEAPCVSWAVVEDILYRALSWPVEKVTDCSLRLQMLLWRGKKALIPCRCASKMGQVNFKSIVHP